MQIQFSETNHLPLADAAAWYARHGFRVFPCRPGGKEPIQGFMWREQATSCPGRVAFLWAMYPESNIGLCMGNGWAALDLDQGEGKDGWRSFGELAGGSATPWPTQDTPGGGKHLLWRCRSQDLRNFARRGPYGGLDMRTDDGYILGAPSTIDGRQYSWVDGDPTIAPPLDLWLACVGWSRPADPVLELPMEPAAMDPEVAQRWSEWFEVKEGEGTGDRSVDAFLKVKQAILLGLDLGQLAAVLPETWIAYFGREPPHNASNPLRWAWKYTVLRAWSATRVAREQAKETPGDPGLREEVMRSRTAESAQPSDYKQTQAQTLPKLPADVYSLLRGRCQRLDEGDRDGLIQLLEQIAASGLSVPDQKMLWAEIKQASGITMEIIREQAKLIADRQREETPNPTTGPLPVFVQGQDKVWLPRERTMVTRQAFAIARARDHGGSVDVTIDHWLTGAGARCEVVQQLIYDPGLPSGAATDEDGVRVWNTYEPTSLVPRGDGSDASVGPWLRLLKDLQIEGGEPVEEALLDRLAYTVQHPGVKINHGLLVGGQQGIGKDSFFTPWLDCVGRRNVNVTEGSSLASDFNGWLSGAKVIVVNEVDYGDHKDRRRVQEKLKPVLAAPPPYLMVNEKNLRPYPVANKFFVVMYTNHRICLSVDTGDRRHLAVWCEAPAPRTKAESDDVSAYFQEYWSWLDAGGSAAVLAWLRARTIREENILGSRPPVTPWLEELMDASEDPLTAWIRDAGTGRVGVFAADTVSTTEIRAWLDTGAGATWGLVGQISIQRIGRALHAAGWRRQRIGDHRHRRWVRPDAETPTGSAAYRDRVQNRRTVVHLRDRHRSAAVLQSLGLEDRTQKLPDWL